MQTILTPQSSYLLCLIYPPSLSLCLFTPRLPHFSTAADFAVSLQWFGQWEKHQLFPLLPLLLLLLSHNPPALPSFSFFYTFPLQSSLRLLLHLLTNPLSFNTLPLLLSFPSSLPPKAIFSLSSLSYHSHSVLGCWLLPSLSLSLLTHSHFPLFLHLPRPQAIQDWDRKCHVLWEKLTPLYECAACSWTFLLCGINSRLTLLQRAY